LTPGGSSTSHIHTQTIHKIRERRIWEVRAVPRLCELYPGICLRTEEKARKTSVRVAQYKNNEKAQYTEEKQYTTQNNKEHRIHNRENCVV
jgi:murein DD-endopeptidase MepM/ murein hydrolase activator NlpD